MSTPAESPSARGTARSLRVPGAGVLRRALRYEDLVLFGFTVFVQPLLTSATGTSGAGDLGNLDAVTSLFYLVACAGAVACLATRARGGRLPRLDSGDMRPADWAPFPFLAALALVGSSALDGLGLGGLEVLMMPIFLLGIAAYFAAPKLPTVTPERRRMLMLPMILAGSAVFGGTMAGLDPFALGSGLLDMSDGSANAIVAAILFTLAIPGPFYAMFVLAPRALADPEGSWGNWVVRYLVWFTGTIISVRWMRALGV